MDNGIQQQEKHHLNIQPFFADLHGGGISISYTENLTNAITLRETLVKEGAIFRTTSDTETIVQLIAKSKRGKIVDKIIDTFQIKGGYSLVILTNKKLIGVRDPFWIRPLVIGKLNDSYTHIRDLRFGYSGANLSERLKGK